MRRRSRTPPDPPEEPSSAETAKQPTGGDAERLAGYRLVRRIATGERADVYLAATVERPGQPPGEPTAESADQRGGLVAMRVYDAHADAEAIATEVEAMAIAPSLPALVDLATLADGRTCVVVERLAGPTLAAIAVGRGLTAGEAVTVLAPIVVAVHELERHGFAHVRLALSDVMFDASGRPRVIGTGGLRRLDTIADAPGGRTALVREMYGALGRLVADVSAMTRPPGALDPVRHLLDELLAVRPFRTNADELERMLFAVAAPAPVAVGSASFERAGGGRRHRVEDPSGHAPPVTTAGALASSAERAARSPAARSSERGALGVEDELAPPRSWLPRSLSSFHGVIHETLADGEPQRAGPSRAGALRARFRGALAGRRAVLVVGALAGGAALVLALTLVPPADPSTAEHEGSATAVASVPAASAVAAGAAAEPEGAAPPSDPAPGEAGGGVPATDTETDAAAAAIELLAVRAQCFAEADAACLDAVLQPGSGLDSADRALMAAVQTGDADAPPPELAPDGARVTGEMGGAWLVEMPYREPEREPASVLVMRSEAGWRLREIFG
ncbi:serine/threonine-protein kinase [Agromyces silvae]|uniref:hypothetical protein n=1 Tax=Agromyces silvae TaxID=3388266 RepID=UPI00280B2B7F|nr:hypothetical protein [Agromyces protaetiae]